MDLSVFGSPTDFQWGLANDPNFLNTAALYGISYQDILNYITPQVQQPTTLLTNQPDTSAQEAEAARIAAERAAEAAYYEEERRRLEAEEAARRAQEAALIEAERLAEIRRLEEAQAIYYPPVVEPTPEPVYNPVYYYASDGAAFLDQTQRNSYESNLQAIYVAQQQAAIAAQEAAARAAAEEQARIAAERAAAERAAQEAAARAAQEAAARAAQEAAERAAQEAATRAAQEAAAKAAADEAARQEALRVAEEQAKAAAAEAERIAKEQQEAKTAAEAAALAEQQRIAQEAAAKAAAELAAQQKAAEEAAAKVAAEEAAKLAAEKAAAEKAAAEQAALQNTEVSTQTGNQTMASRFTPEEEAAIVDYVVSNINNPTAIQQAAAQYGVTAQDLANVLGKPLETVQKYFLDAGVPQGTLLTGDVQRTFGTEGNITQLDKGEDFVVEKAIGMQGDKILVQAYDAYGLPTSTRLADPNTSEGKGWLQALAIVGGAIGLSNLATTGSLLGGTTAGTGTAVGGAGTAGLLGGESALAVAGVEGAASQAATSAFANTLAATGNASLAAIAADVASGNVAAGLSVADAVAAGVSAATTGAATGVVTATGEVIGGGGSITAGVPTSLLTPSAVTPTTTTTTTPTTTTPTTTTPTTTPTTTTPTTTTPTTTTPTTTTPTTTPTTTTPTSFNPTSLLPNIANTLLQGLTNASAASTLAGLVSSGANLAMVNDAAQKLRDQGKLSQTEYNTIATNLAGLYRDVGFEAKTGLQDVASKASGMIGKFTPYGVSNQLFGTKVSPTGQLETTMTATGAELYAPFARVAGQSALAAENMNIETLASDYYKKLAALSAPETERQRLALEERMRQQGRLGILSSNIDPITGKARVSTAPELLAQEQAIARQQLERELQSRQAALGERGALITQGTTAYSPISNLLGLQSQQQQLSGQLGQAATQADVARASAYMQPATAAITAPLSLYGQGLQQVGQTQRLGTASNLASQQAALDALAVGRSNTANQLLGQGGSNLTSLFNTASSLFNQPSNYVPGTNITYADALNQGILPL
jgi:hypothetical protein